MAGQKFWAHGMTISFASVQIGGVVDVQGPGGATDKVETTDSDAGGVETSVPGLTRPAQMTITCRRILGDAGQSALRTASTNKTVAEVVITYPDSATDDSTVGTDTFDAWVTDWNLSNPAVEGDPAGIEFTLETSGAVTEAVA